jgi:hypothetical protein
MLDRSLLLVQHKSPNGVPKVQQVEAASLQRRRQPAACRPVLARSPRLPRSVMDARANAPSFPSHSIVTGLLGVDFSTHPINVLVDVDPETGLAAVDIDHDPTFFVGAFSLQYSLIYMNSNVIELPEFMRNLIPLVEVNFATPFANIGPSIPGIPDG